MPVEQIEQAAQTAVASGEIDLALKISIIALIVSAVSPLLSSIISGIFQLITKRIETASEIRQKQLELKAEAERRHHEFYEQHRAEVIERYINSVGKAIQDFASGNRQQFGESMGEVYMYVDKSLWPLLDSIAKKFDRHNPVDPSEELMELCQKLSEEGIRAKYEERLNSPSES